MLEHKVDGENPAIYSNMLLAAKKVERQAEARDALHPKTTKTGGSNITQPQTLTSQTSNEEDPETFSGIGGADQLDSYIICFAKAVKLY